MIRVCKTIGMTLVGVLRQTEQLESQMAGYSQTCSLYWHMYSI